MTGGEIAQPAYWVKHTRQAVRFADGIASPRKGCQVFVEIGPNPTLLGLVRHCCPNGGVLVPSSRRADNEQFLRAVSDLYAHGVAIDWKAVHREQPWRPLTLPTYPFQRRRYWVDGVKHTARSRRAIRGAMEHPLLGWRLEMPGSARGEVRYEQDLDKGSFIRHHRVFQRAILPAAAYLEMGLALASRNTSRPAPPGLPVLKNVTIQRALVLAEDHDRTIQMVMTPEASEPALSIARFDIYSLSEDELGQAPIWTLHVSGQICHEASSRVPPPRKLETAQAEFGNEIAVAAFYQHCHERGLIYGPDFQILKRLWRGEGQAMGFAQLPERLAGEAEQYHVHPVLYLDACLQVLLATLPESGQGEIWLPVGLKRLQLYRSPGTQLWCHAQLQVVEDAGHQTFLADLSLLDPYGATVGRVEQLRARKADPSILLGALPDLESWLYGVDWRPQGLCDPRVNATRLPAPSELGEELRGSMAELIDQSRLEEYGKALEELDKLCVAYILTAFNDMGHAFRCRDQFSTLELAETLGVVDTQQPLLDRMLAMLAEEGNLQVTRTGWQVIRVPPPGSVRSGDGAVVSRRGRINACSSVSADPRGTSCEYGLASRDLNRAQASSSAVRGADFRDRSRHGRGHRSPGALPARSSDRVCLH